MSTETLDALNEIRSLARDFATAELRPHTEAWDHAGALPPGIRVQLAELGFLGMRVPESSGGMGFDAPTFVAALEELAWGEPAVALNVAVAAIAAETIATHGTAAQQAAWLAEIADGGQVPTLSLASGAGAQLRVTRAGDGVRLDGTAAWLADPAAATFVLLEVAELEGGAGGFAIVRTDADGFSIGAPRQTMGLRPLAIADAELAAVEVAGDGWIAAAGGDAAGAALAGIGRLALAAVAVGIAAAALEHAREYAGVREQFGRSIRTFEGIGRKLAEMRVRTDAARALLGEAARGHAAGDGGTVASLGARIVAADTAMWVTTQAVQVFGGYGYMRDYPVEKLMRDARAAGMLMEKNDALRDLVADALYNG
jgi:acyl-CoA dehydrogenase